MSVRELLCSGPRSCKAFDSARPCALPFLVTVKHIKESLKVVAVLRNYNSVSCGVSPRHEAHRVREADGCSFRTPQLFVLCPDVGVSVMTVKAGADINYLGQPVSCDRCSVFIVHVSARPYVSLFLSVASNMHTRNLPQPASTLLFLCYG